MGERKVLNKYIPADFDPKLVPRTKRPKDNLVPVRMMLPFSIQCATCSSFMYRGRKFNSKKEPVSGRNGKYLSIQRYRFYIKCTHCSRPITFLTDPQNADYEMENGAKRNYEIWHDKTKSNEEIIQEEETEEQLDPMKALENRVLDSQREMADLDNLDEIKAMNMKHLQIMGGKEGSFNQISSFLHSKNELEKTPNETIFNEHGLTKEEEDVVQNVQFRTRRLNTLDEQKNDLKRKQNQEDAFRQQLSLVKPRISSDMPAIKIKPKKLKIKPENNQSNIPTGGISCLLGAYASDDSDDSN